MSRSAEPAPDKKKTAEEETPVETLDQQEEAAAEEAQAAEKQNGEEEAQESETDALRRQVEELNDSLLRARAEFDNFRKRTQQEKAIWNGVAQERVALALLPAKDDLERILEQPVDAQNVDTLLQGLQLVVGKFDKGLAEFGVQPFESKGTPFNEELHDALTTMSDPGQDEDIVLVEHQKGYKMGDRVIRHAQVIVNKPEQDS